MTDFQRFIEVNNVKKKDIANYLGVSNAFITQLCNGLRAIPLDKLALIKAKSGWDITMFESGPMESTVKERLLSFIASKKMKNAEFERLAGLSNGYLNNFKGNIGAKKLDDILNGFPDLNKVWLLTGEGEMIRKDKVEISSDKEQQLLDIITSQQQTIASLTKILDSRDKEKSAADALPDATAECAAAAGK